MAKYCTKCGAELKDGADICLDCGALINKNQATMETESTIVKAPKKPKTHLFNLLAGIAFSLMVMFYIASLFQGYVDTLNNYFWIGDDQFLGLISWLAFLAMGIVSFVFSGKELKQEKISVTDRYISIFLFVTSILFAYLIFQQIIWQLPLWY